MEYRIVYNLDEFTRATQGWEGLVAIDTETRGKVWDPQGRLLGLSLSPENWEKTAVQGIYIPFNIFQDGLWRIVEGVPLLHPYLKDWIASRGLVGHNFTYDDAWLTRAGFALNWVADTRIMWHLASAPAGPRPYGLKDAQKELLGWAETNEKELEANVKAKGGSLRNGDHYLADLDILAKYACIDTLSTIAVYSRCAYFFELHDYWWMLQKMMQYNRLLENNTRDGIKVDTAGLTRAHRRLLSVKEAAKKRVYKELKESIASLEQDWVDRRIAKYKREYNKSRYLDHPEEWERFNFNSDAHKRELFYDKLGNQTEYHTESGKPSTSADSVRRFNHSFVEPYLKYEKANTLSTSFSGPYLEHSANDGRLHPGFNICGTVSYRLSGFKPYLLNAPFDEKGILKNMVCDDGYVGLHADFAAIEPAITAHYSEDPALLRVLRDGVGDIYLDLALELFKDDKELQSGYDPCIPITSAIKERFSKQRKIAKIIQLAVQYTGTGVTVARNLSKNGIPTSVDEAQNYVHAYWRKFAKVAQLNYRLFELNKKDGLLRNVIGRIIRVPYPDYKDLPNRFIQSSAHDCLIEYVLIIDRLKGERKIDMAPMLVDCHDSTSWRVRKDQIEAAEKIFEDALQELNHMLQLTVRIRIEKKRFKTFAGLKAEE